MTELPGIFKYDEQKLWKNVTLIYFWDLVNKDIFFLISEAFIVYLKPPWVYLDGFLWQGTASSSNAVSEEETPNKERDSDYAAQILGFFEKLNFGQGWSFKQRMIDAGCHFCFTISI